MTRTARLLSAALVLLATAALVACGDDDDDFSDIKGSATAAATAQPTATPTAAAGNTTAYTKSIRDEAAVLKTALKKLNDDMLAAQTNQSDPAVPAKLKADVQAVNDSVAKLKAMKAPESLAKFSTDLVAALDQIKKGADGVAEAVDSANQATGLAAFTNLSGGQAKLEAALATLPS